jgi:hypothetical protein
MATIYTIGHSTRSIDDFTDLLTAYGIHELIDIRTVNLHKLREFAQVGPDEVVTYPA